VVVVLAAAMPVGLPAGASAATVSMNDQDVVFFVAAGGEANRVTVSAAGGDLAITDDGPGVTLTGDGSCTVVAQTATCAGAEAVSLDARDRDDRVSLDGTVPPRLDSTIFGGLGDDTLRGGRSSDFIVGDLVDGTGGRDTMSGGPGSDGLFGYGSADHASGGGDDDSIDGGAGADRLAGNAGDDRLFGDFGAASNDADDLDGGPGRDSLGGGGGDDTLRGRTGDDRFVAEPGADWISGGRDRDLVDYTLRRPRVVVSIGRGGADDGNEVDGSPGARDEVLGNIEDLIGTGAGDTLIGNRSDNLLIGAGGPDTATGGAGADTIDTGRGADRVAGGLGIDSLDAGGENDILRSRDDRADQDLCGDGADLAWVDAQDAVAADCETVHTGG
jgi:Ca2+-binding RTX toxin-like protein